MTTAIDRIFEHYEVKLASAEGFNEELASRLVKLLRREKRVKADELVDLFAELTTRS